MAGRHVRQSSEVSWQWQRQRQLFPRRTLSLKSFPLTIALLTDASSSSFPPSSSSSSFSIAAAAAAAAATARSKPVFGRSIASSIHRSIWATSKAEPHDFSPDAPSVRPSIVVVVVVVVETRTTIIRVEKKRKERSRYSDFLSNENTA